MARVAFEGHAHSAGLDTLADDCLHRRYFFTGRVPLLGCITHNVAPHSGMTDQRSNVHTEPLIHCIEVLGDGFPGPFDSGLNGFERNRFDMGQDSSEVFTIFLMRRRHRQRTVADDDGRDSVIARVRTKRVPGDLGIVVRVVVDDAGSDHRAIRIDDSLRRAADPSDLDDPPAAHGDVAVKTRQSGTVNNVSVLDN